MQTPQTPASQSPASAPPSFLNSGQRIFFVFTNVALGLLPSLAFFAWVERNSSLPQIGLELGWPWLSIQSWPASALAVWNCALFFAFGFLHSLTAQNSFQLWLRKWLPAQAIRTLYIALTGLSLVALMGLWQNTGIVLWTVPLPWLAVNTLSFAIFWCLLSTSLLVMSQFNPLEFLGLKQIYSSATQLSRSEGTPRLLTTGIYARVRHPIYTFTSLAFFVTPFMTLDRALVCASMALYLLFAIPLEERKLVTLFGRSYEEYRTQVPAVIPRLLKR